jgi:hypothetical protein
MPPDGRVPHLRLSFCCSLRFFFGIGKDGTHYWSHVIKRSKSLSAVVVVHKNFVNSETKFVRRTNQFCELFETCRGCSSHRKEMWQFIFTVAIFMCFQVPITGTVPIEHSIWLGYYYFDRICNCVYNCIMMCCLFCPYSHRILHPFC